MKVAIMGAGLSGLSCAITLENNGIRPVLFEKRSRVGDRFVNGEALFNIFNKPVNNCLDYIADKYDIHLEPVSRLKKIIIYSPNESGSIEGNLGAINIRGRHEASFENQLAKQVKSEIIYNSKYSLEELKQGFTHVVLATGDGAYSTQLNNYRCDLTYTLKGATVEGKFLPGIPSAWFNDSFVPKGYAFQLPFSEKESNIVLAYPDYPENRERDLDAMWELFYNQACRDFGQSLRVTDRFEITRYIVGICERPKIDKVYFVGNCFGALAPFLGFGQFIALLTGVYAAYDICGIDEYENLCKPLYQNYEKSLVIRKAIEQLDEKKLDLLVKNLDNRLVDNLIDKIFSDDSSFDLLKWISVIVKPWIKEQEHEV